MYSTIPSLDYEKFINETELIVRHTNPQGAPYGYYAFIMTQDRTVGAFVHNVDGICKFAKWGYPKPDKIFRNIEQQFGVKVENEASIS